MEDFVLPDKWCIKVTDENKSALENWREHGGLVYASGYCVSNFGGVKGWWFKDCPEPYKEITFEQFKQYVLKQKPMESKELKITPPEGYEIDKQKSTLEHIVFKPVDKKPKTWEEIQVLHQKKGSTQFYIDVYSDVEPYSFCENDDSIQETSRNVNTQRQAERIRALCQLYVIADHYNGGWVADWENEEQLKCFPCWDNKDNVVYLDYWTDFSTTTPVFKSDEILLEAYENNKEIFETALKP